MSDAPETIWLTNFLRTGYGAKLGRGVISDLDHGHEYPKYRRANLPPTTEQIMADQRVKALVEAATEYAEYFAMCGESGDLQRNLEAALAQLKEPKP
jgi:hypothetical protein